MTEGRDAGLAAVLEFVRDSRGFDFTGYKRSSIQRRVAKRMSEVDVETFEDYVDYLQLHADEYAQLFNTLLINVTGFMRDPQTWEYVATDVLPRLIESKSADSPIRVWSAGCASGEEPYTVAMLLARVMGEEAYRERVKIYGTDVDEEALDHARLGAYMPRQVEDIPAEALDRFFERTEQRYVFRKDLRRNVIFGRNDLVQDAPISRIDLLVCRNTLMYFTAETQSQILRRFHFALDAGGVLVLGKSEMLVTHSDLFTPIDLKRRVFGKVVKPSLRERPRVLAADPGNGASQSVGDSLREAAFDIGDPARLVLDADGVLMMANHGARSLFSLSPHDLGKPFQDLEVSYRPAELRSHLDTIKRDPRAIEVHDVYFRSRDLEHVFDIHIAPLLSEGVLLGTSIAYVDVTASQALQEELTSSKRELGQASEELQATVEELETTNEELQSTNEELETTNEELQSTNEELETMNEELQSSNEELQTMNDELRHRSLELNDLNAFLEKILTTYGLAVAVVDRDLRVKIWNSQAHELWGLRPDEVEDQHLFSLDFGLPVESLRTQIRSVLGSNDGREEMILDATNRRGRAFQCRVTLLPLSGSDGERPGVIMMMEPVAHESR